LGAGFFPHGGLPSFLFPFLWEGYHAFWVDTLRGALPSAYGGVIVLKMSYRTSELVQSMLWKMLREVEENEFAGALFIVDHNKWRKRTRP
jgi:hypothetical protein